jgi:RHH-type transcriptional regulator, rel operon repressor / antitoxin RelB
MLCVELEPEVEQRLTKLAQETGQSKGYYAAWAIREFLEDREDYRLGMEALRRNEPRTSLEDLWKELASERIAALLHGNSQRG